MAKIGKTWSLIFDSPTPVSGAPHLRRTAAGWTPADFSRVMAQAKQAFQEGRFKNSLTLTNVVLQNDPDNVDAQALEYAIQLAIENPLTEDISEAAPPEAPTAAELSPPAPVAVIDVFEAAPEPAAALDAAAVELRMRSQDQGAPAPGETSAAEAEFAASSRRLGRGAWLALQVSALVGVVAASAILMLRARDRQIPIPMPAPAQAAAPQQPLATGFDITPVATAPAELAVAAPASAALNAAAPAPVFNPPPNARPEKPGSPAGLNPAIPPAGLPAAAASAVVSKPDRARPGADGSLGSLAVASTLPADIYENNAYVGSTPATLRLPAGPHTLEYRYRNLRKMITHVIKPNELTAANITFEVQVQINARPWAQVTLENGGRQPLGQTPLSGVIVPAGSTLIFENPNFPAKRYRVTGAETAIQVAFP